MLKMDATLKGDFGFIDLELNWVNVFNWIVATKMLI